MARNGEHSGAMRVRFFARSLVVLSLLAGAACDDKPQAEPAKAAAAKPEEPEPEAPKPKRPAGPPELAIDTISPKVGFTRVLPEPDKSKVTETDEKLQAKLDEEIAKHRSHYEGQTVKLEADRKAPAAWVAAMVASLAKVGVGAITVPSDTRADLPKELTLTPQSKALDAAPCSVVTTVLADRGTAVWKLSGGVAMKRTKGFAGPDLTMTSETIERLGKACKTSSTIYVGGAPGLEWGLVYDLAAAAKSIASPKFERIVLLREAPVAGRPVKLKD